MRAARQALVLSALEARSSYATTAATSTPAQSQDSTSSSPDYGPVPSLPPFRADLFPHGKFLSIKTRSPDAYMDARRDLRTRSRELEAQIKQIVNADRAPTTAAPASSSASPRAPEQDDTFSQDALDAYTPLPLNLAEELLAADAKARRLESMQGFVLCDADVYQLFHTHVQCGSFDLAVCEWLLKRILADARGPPYPLLVCQDIATLLRLQCLPRLPDTTRSGVLLLSRLESALGAIEATQQPRRAQTALSSTSPRGADALAESLSRSPSHSVGCATGSVELAASATVADHLLAQYVRLVDQCLPPVVSPQTEEGEAEESESTQTLRGALQRVLARVAVPVPPPTDTNPRDDDAPGLDNVIDLLTLHDTMASASSPTSLPFAAQGWTDAFTHAQQLVHAVRGAAVQSTHPYPLHVMGTWLLPIWEACSSLNMFLAETVPLVAQANDSEDAALGDGDRDEENGDDVKLDRAGEADITAESGAAPSASSSSSALLALLIADPAVQAEAVQKLLMTFTPLHTPFAASAAHTFPLSFPREGRQTNSSSTSTTTPSTNTTTIPAVAPLDVSHYGNTPDALSLGPLRAITDVFLLLAEAVATLKEVQLITALQVAFCGAFLRVDDEGDKGAGVQLAVDAWTGTAAPADPTTRAKVADHLAQFASDFLAVTAYGRESYTTNSVTWGLYDRLSLLSSAATRKPSTTTSAALALAMIHIEAQQVSAVGAARMGSVVERALNACLAGLADTLTAGAEASPSVLESGAAYAASAACDVERMTRLTTRAKATAPEEAEQVASRMLSSVHTRAAWRSAVLNTASPSASEREAAVPVEWEAWMERLEQSIASSSSSSLSSDAAEEVMLTLNGAVEHLIYHYATRMEQQLLTPMRVWAADYLGVSAPGTTASEEGGDETTAVEWSAEAAASWCHAAQTELLGRVERLVKVTSHANDSTGALPWQPATLASLALLISAGLRGTDAALAADARTPSPEATRGQALLACLSELMDQLVATPSSSISARSGNALSVVLLCLARAGQWNAVLRLLRRATGEEGSAHDGQWSSATTLDSVVLAEVFGRARAAGAAGVCARLRQLRETVFF